MVRACQGGNRVSLWPRRQERPGVDHVFLNVLNVVLPVLICAGVGYCLARVRAPFDNKVIRGIVSNVGYPILIISHLSTTKLAIGTFLDKMAAAAMAVAGFGALGFVALKTLRLPVRAFLTPLMHGNVGNIGLPITMLALGDVGMAYAMAFVVLVSIFTVGMWIPTGVVSLRKLATNLFIAQHVPEYGPVSF